MVNGIKKEEFTPPFYHKTDEQIERIESVLSKSFLFKAIFNDESTKKQVVGALAELSSSQENSGLTVGNRLINEGDEGDFCYVIEEGELECWKNLKNQDTGIMEEKMVKSLKPGDVFGELSLLYNTTRAASVQVKSNNCILWKLDRSTFNHIVKDASITRRGNFETVLKSVELLVKLSDHDRSQLIESLEEERVTAGTYIITEGADGDKFYILAAGEAEAYVKGKVEPVQSYQGSCNAYFGELALLHNQPRAATVVAKTDCKLFSLKRECFNRLLGPLMTKIKSKTRTKSREILIF